MERPAFKTRIIRLLGQSQRDIALAAVANAPLDPEKPIELVLREQRKTRKPTQNEAMWAGPLRDIAEQAWCLGRSYPAETWHEYYKEAFLPELDDPEINTLVRDGYRKWDITPGGKRVLIGSTTQLTVRGMALYMTQIEAHGSNLGVQFSVNPNEGRV